MGHWLAEVDTKTFAVNIGVLLTTLAAAAVGSLTAIKSIKKAFIEIFKDDDKTKPDTKVASAMLMETYTLAMWSESNRDVVEQMKELRFEIRRLADRMEEHNRVRQ